jgi:molybdopterin/thiamine biosynthesis adenylyltransferase
MPGKFHHEALDRGADQVAKLGGLRVAVCGAGALGSNLADNLVRQGVGTGDAGLLRVIDRDRVEEHNVSTQLYGEGDVGVWKVEVLRNRLFKTVGVEIDAVRKEMSEQNAGQLLKGVDLVIDTFDNSASRAVVQRAVRAAGTACLHAGLYEDYCEVVWDPGYRVPGDVGQDVCDYPLARNLVMLAVTIASESVIRYLRDGRTDDFSATLGDLAVRVMEGE